jgi:hypothetical protein
MILGVLHRSFRATFFRMNGNWDTNCAACVVQVTDSPNSNLYIVINNVQVSSKEVCL